VTTKKKPPEFADISGEYWQLFLECSVDPKKYGLVKATVSTIVGNRPRYTKVVAGLGTVPWWFLALIHAMESSLSFGGHLHNGDKLTGRTIHVPAARPIGNPRAKPNESPSAANPYTWEESAEDSLRLKGLDKWTDWSLRAALFKLEQYNGWGYRMYHPDVLSPYLWSWTNKYTKGKYAADGKFDANLVSAQPGAAALLRVMVDSGLVMPIDYMGDFPDPPTGSAFA
jgi:lysozyme family protein